MFKRLAVLVLIAHLPACADEPGRASAPVPQPCSDAWYRLVEASLPTGDGQGHGPDPGSDEWKSVIEFRLGIRGKAGVPARDSEAWCRHVGRLVGVADAADAPPATPAPRD